MLRYFILVFSFISCTNAFAQVDICQSQWGFEERCFIYVENGKVWMAEQEGMQPTLVLNFDGSRVYAGATNFGSDCVFTIFGDNVFTGNSTMRSNIVYTVIGERIYRGDSFAEQDVLWTVYDGKIYRGSSTSASDQVFVVYDDYQELTLQQLACILSAFQ